MKNRAQFLVSFELLESLLLFPEGAKILFADQDSNDRLYGRFRLLVDHPDLPGIYEGELPTIICPEYEIDAEGNSTFTGWGLE